jgi:hypothetical protein
MEEVFQIIIFLFVIWSFLSSAFKKKTEPNKQQTQNLPKTNTRKKKMDYSTKDVLENLFGSQFPNAESELPEHVNKQRSPGNLDKDWKAEYRNLEKNKSVEEKVLQTTVYDNILSLDANAKIKRIKPSETLNVQRDQISKRAIEIKSKMKNTSNIRDAVLLSEILNKPKALRT